MTRFAVRHYHRRDDKQRTPGADEYLDECDDDHGDGAQGNSDLYRARRTRTTPEQLRVLQTAFMRDQMPSAADRQTLGEMIGMNPRSVQVWFQNRRVKDWQSVRRSTGGGPFADEQQEKSSAQTASRPHQPQAPSRLKKSRRRAAARSRTPAARRRPEASPPATDPAQARRHKDHAALRRTGQAVRRLRGHPPPARPVPVRQQIAIHHDEVLLQGFRGAWRRHPGRPSAAGNAATPLQPIRIWVRPIIRPVTALGPFTYHTPVIGRPLHRLCRWQKVSTRSRSSFSHIIIRTGTRHHGEPPAA